MGAGTGFEPIDHLAYETDGPPGLPAKNGGPTGIFALTIWLKARSAKHYTIDPKNGGPGGS